jgi:thiamine-monophosphate kinase
MRSEFEFINHIKNKYRLSHVGDDCAILPKDATTDLLISADLLVEDVDFQLEWTTPEQLGHKALAVSLSDIAAMGGMPANAMLSLGLPESLWRTNFLDGFYEGWHGLARRYSIELVGGDISRSSSLVIDSVVLGEASTGTAIRRSTAHPGDAVFVSGALGGAAGGLALLRDGKKSGPLTQRQLTPLPQLIIGKLLRDKTIATSCIDISDGLSSDLKHICDGSGVGAVLDVQLIPVDTNLSHHFSCDQSLQFALHGGEDYELLFTVPEDNMEELSDIDATRIGTITTERGIRLIADGEEKPIDAGGFTHF